MKYYTSDLHFDHGNIIAYESRPWDTVEEMNEGLIANINERVGGNDELYILGDFTLRSQHNRIVELREAIKCKHVHLIVGNHDYFAKNAWAKDLFETITPYKEIYDGNQKLILCHFPILSWNRMSENSIHLYGHVHSRPRLQHPHPHAYNVGVDVNDYYPVTLEEIKKGLTQITRFDTIKVLPQSPPR